MVVGFSTLSRTSTNTVVAATTTVERNDENSVVWLVLDELPLYALLTTEGNINGSRFPGFALLAKSSTWYRNTLATAQRTTEAVPSILDGMWPTMRNYPVVTDHPVNLFTLSARHKKLDVYQSITSLCPEGLCANKIPNEERQAEFQVAAFKKLIINASTSTKGTVHFSHLQLPHRPWRLSPDGRLGRDLEVDPRSSRILDRRRDAYQAMLKQLVATDALLLELLTTLQQSANWSRTTIVVTSDHGLTFVPGESVRDHVNPTNPGTLEDIYRVPLFIKYPSQTSAVVSDCPVSSIDILPTVLSAAQIPHNKTFDGVDLLVQCPTSRDRRVQWPYSGTTMATGFNALLQRVAYYDTWVAANGSVNDIYRVGLSGALIGTTLALSTSVTSQVSWKNIDPRSFENIGDEPLSYVPSRVSGQLFTSKNLCSRCEGILVVNGIVVAVIPELAGTKPTTQPAYFTTSIATNYVTPRSSPPELWIVNWTTSTPVFTRIQLAQPK